MRLRKERVAQIARKMTDKLFELENVEMLGDRQSAEFQITESFLDDFAAEEELEAEVTKLLSVHLQGQSRDSVNYAELFRKAKAKLAKDRGLVI